MAEQAIVTGNTEPSASPTADLPFDMQMWQVIVQYDRDIAAADEQIKPFGAKWQGELAAAYMALPDKNYLPTIVRKVKALALSEAMEKARAQLEEGARLAEQHHGSEVKRPERLDHSAWYDFHSYKTWEKAILLVFALALILWIIALAIRTLPLASGTGNGEVNAVKTVSKPVDPNVGPSFDCQKADGKVLKLICSTPQLSAADRDMAAAYQAVQTPPIDIVLRNSQQDWLITRDNSIADVSFLAELYKDRINFLKHYHHAITPRRSRKPTLVKFDDSLPGKTENQSPSKTPHECTHEELVQARIARMNEYTGGPNCTNGP